MAWKQQKIKFLKSIDFRNMAIKQQKLQGTPGNLVRKSARMPKLVSDDSTNYFHADGVQNANGKLLPVCCRHVVMWPFTTVLTLGTSTYRLKDPVLLQNHAGRVKNSAGILLPVWFRHLGNWSPLCYSCWRRSERKRKLLPVCRRHVLKRPLTTKLAFDNKLKNTLATSKTPSEYYFRLVPPSWKMAATPPVVF